MQARIHFLKEIVNVHLTSNADHRKIGDPKMDLNKIQNLDFCYFKKEI